jgi:hypothetical protein
MLKSEGAAGDSAVTSFAVNKGQPYYKLNRHWTDDKTGLAEPN